MKSCWMESFQPSSCERVSAVRRQFLAWLAPMELPEELVESMAIALTEACANAVQHGSPHGDRDSFLVRCRLGEGRLAVEVIDYGPGFTCREVSCPDPLDLDESGRGIWLMAQMTDRMEFPPAPRGTQVYLEKRLPVV
jgi:serine/threonine-protein kinase RsbW